MSTAYTLLNGLTVAFGFVMAVIALVLLMIGNSAAHLLIIALLIILIGIQGWQYIQTLVRLDDLAKAVEKLQQD